MVFSARPMSSILSKRLSPAVACADRVQEHSIINIYSTRVASPLPEKFEQMKDEFYDIRCWDICTGLQKKDKLKDFDLQLMEIR